LFNSPHFESGETEITDVDAREFLGFIQSVETKRVTGRFCSSSFFLIRFLDSSVEPLLKMAKRFKAPLLTKVCEEYMSATDGISDAKKLFLADLYQLDDLKVGFFFSNE